MCTYYLKQSRHAEDKFLPLLKTQLQKYNKLCRTTIHRSEGRDGFSCPFPTQSPRAHTRHVPQHQVGDAELQLSSPFLQEGGSGATALPFPAPGHISSSWKSNTA